MADKITISEMIPASTRAASDIVPGVVSGLSKSLTLEQILMTQASTETLWKNFVIPPIATKLGGSKDPDFVKFADNGAGSQGVFLYHFDSAIEEELYVDAFTPTDWKEETTFYGQFYWIPVSNGGVGETVSWGIEMTATIAGGIFGNTGIIYADTSVPSETLVANKLYYTEFVIPGTGLNVNSAFAIRIFRDATSTGGTDTYGNDVALIALSTKYQADGFGSLARDSK